MGIMKRIFTDHQIFLEDRGYINEEDAERVFDMPMGIVSTDDKIKCKRVKRGKRLSCTVKSGKYRNFNMKKEKVDAIDIKGTVFPGGNFKIKDVTMEFEVDSVCSVVNPRKEMTMGNKKILVCKEIGGL